VHPGLLGEVLAACAALPDERSDRELTADLDIARGLLTTLAESVHLHV
jgi:hypothetical protein